MVINIQFPQTVVFGIDKHVDRFLNIRHHHNHSSIEMVDLFVDRGTNLVHYNVHALIKSVLFNQAVPDVRTGKITPIEFCLECDCPKFVEEEEGQERINQ